MTFSAEAIVGLGCLVAAFFWLGVEVGKGPRDEFVCPRTEQGQKLISIFNRDGGTICTYNPAPTARATTKRKA